MITATIAFGNVGNLPLVFVDALCGDSGAIFYQSLGEHCKTVGIGYTAFDICVATIFQFTIAIQLLKNGEVRNNALSADEDGGAAVVLPTLSSRKDHNGSDALRSDSDPRLTVGGGSNRNYTYDIPDDIQGLKMELEQEGRFQAGEIELQVRSPPDEDSEWLLGSPKLSEITSPERTTSSRTVWFRRIDWASVMPLALAP